MNTDLNTLVAKIVEQRQGRLPELDREFKNLNNLSTALEQTKNCDLRTRAEFKDNFDSIPFGAIEKKIGRAREQLDLAITRFKRSNISIAVAGAARQGKSQMLQMLTGLSDTQIPTGDGGFCTAARSEIINDTTNQPTAQATFLS